MAERTPEQINEMITDVEHSLSTDREDPNYRLFGDSLNSLALSDEFREGAKIAKGVERFQGIVDGIRYAIGEGELPDIEKMRLVRDAMKKYLPPEVLRAVSGESGPVDIQGGQNG